MFVSKDTIKEMQRELEHERNERLKMETKLEEMALELAKLTEILSPYQNVSKMQQKNVESTVKTNDNSFDGRSFLRDFAPTEGFYPNEDYEDKR